MTNDSFEELPLPLQNTANELRTVLQEHARTVEPRTDSYLTLSNRLDAHAPPGVVRRFRLPVARMVSAAAMILLVAGTVGILATRARQDDVTAQIPTTLPATTVPSTTTPSTTAEPTPSSTPEPEPPPPVPVTSVPEVVGPVAASPTDAALAFLRLLDMPTEGIELDDSGTGVVTIERNDIVVAELAVAEVESDDQDTEESTDDPDPGPTYVVKGARSLGIELDPISDDVVRDSVIPVAGVGRGFEASLTVTVRSAYDGTVLTRTFARGGCCEEPEPFEVDVPVVGAEVAWVVVNSDGAGSGQLTEFAARPVVYLAEPDPMNYTVFRVSPDDPDEGLNIRDHHGTDEGNVLDTLPPGATGIRRLPRLPALVGDSVWWQVVTTDGLEGWVHSAFLAEQAGSSDAELQMAAEFTTFFIRSGNDSLQFLPLPHRYKVALGWLGSGEFELATAAELRTEEFWSSRRDWVVPEATFSEPTLNLSVRSFLNLPEDENAAEVLVDASQPYGLDQAVVDMYFAGTRSVTMIGPATAEGPWRNVVYFFETTRNGPELVGITTSIQVP